MDKDRAVGSAPQIIDRVKRAAGQTAGGAKLESDGRPIESKPRFGTLSTPSMKATPFVGPGAVGLKVQTRLPLLFRKDPLGRRFPRLLLPRSVRRQPVCVVKAKRQSRRRDDSHCDARHVPGRLIAHGSMRAPVVVERHPGADADSRLAPVRVGFRGCGDGSS